MDADVVQEVLYTVPDVAKYLRCSERQVFELIRRGDLPRIKIGRMTRISPKQLATYVAAHAVSSEER